MNKKSADTKAKACVAIHLEKGTQLPIPARTLILIFSEEYMVDKTNTELKPGDKVVVVSRGKLENGTVTKCFNKHYHTFGRPKTVCIPAVTIKRASGRSSTFVSNSKILKLK